MTNDSSSHPAAAGNSSSSNDGGAVVVPDAKLLHLVEKQLFQLAPPSQYDDDDASRTISPQLKAKDIVTVLRAQYREYQRKNSTQLVRDVEAALQHLARQTAAAAAAGAKRLAASKCHDKADDVYEQAAQRHDAARQQSKVGSSLNDSLRRSYHKRSRAGGAPTVEPNSDAGNMHEISTVDHSNVMAQQDETSSTMKKKRKKHQAKSMNGRTATSTDGDHNELSIQSPFLVLGRPTERYTDLGGLGPVIRELRQLVEYPIVRPELYQHLGVEPPRGVLLRGPPGCGKTHLAKAVAGQLAVSFFHVAAPALVSNMSGDSELRIRHLFQAASDLAPSIIFLDELDAIAQKRGGDSQGGRGMEQRIVAQLLTSLDGLAPHNNRHHAPVIVLAATNRPDALDPALRRAGRLDREILLGVPDETARAAILRSMTIHMRLEGEFDMALLARKTPGFVGADLRSLAKEAAVVAINRIVRDVLPPDKNKNFKLDSHPSSPALTETAHNDEAIADHERSHRPLTAEEMAPLFVTMADFVAAIPSVQPSSTREGFATVPDVSWNDIGALRAIREELTLSVLEPIQHPEKFHQLGLTLPAGVLLFGPPGCGKTLIAKAVAHESGANFISVKGPELLDKYVGESEKAVRVVFERARSSSPCIIFFDELDSLVPRRGSDVGGGGVSERVVNQLLTEMDGLDSRRTVFVIAATNRPELIDPAMMRPGRLDKLLFVPLPSPEDRVAILHALAKNMQLADDVDMDKIGRSAQAECFSGADCAALLREAGLAVLREDAHQPMVRPLQIADRHFSAAFLSVQPSVSKTDEARYDRVRINLARARSRVVVLPAHHNVGAAAGSGDGPS